MVARKLLVHHKDSHFEVEYETDDGLEVFYLIDLSFFFLISSPTLGSVFLVGSQIPALFLDLHRAR